MNHFLFSNHPLANAFWMFAVAGWAFGRPEGAFALPEPLGWLCLGASIGTVMTWWTQD